MSGFTPLRKCIATVALSGTLRDKLEACASVGFDGVEIMEADLLTFEGSAADVRRICDVTREPAVRIVPMPVGSFIERTLVIEVRSWVL